MGREDFGGLAAPRADGATAQPARQDGWANRLCQVLPPGLDGGSSLVGGGYRRRGPHDPQLYGLDFRQSVQRLEVPVYILDGAAELKGRRDLMLEWFNSLQDPTKQLVTYQNAAHLVAFEQADEVQRLLNETIVPATYEH